MRGIPSPSIVTNSEPTRYDEGHVLYTRSELRDCRLRSSYNFPEIPVHCSPTTYARVSSCSHVNVAMLSCSSFTLSERFFQTYQLIIKLRCCAKTNFIRMLMRTVFVNVFKSCAVIWWAAIFRTPSSKSEELWDEPFEQL